MAQQVGGECRAERFDQQPACRCRIGKFSAYRPRDLLDQRIVEPAVILKLNAGGVAVELCKRRRIERRRRQIEMNALADLAVQADHVLADAGRTEPDHARHRGRLLQPAIAAPAHVQPALDQHDHLGFPRFDFRQIAGQMTPSLGQQPVPGATVAGREASACRVFLVAVTNQSRHWFAPTLACFPVTPGSHFSGRRLPPAAAIDAIGYRNMRVPATPNAGEVSATPQFRAKQPRDQTIRPYRPAAILRFATNVRQGEPHLNRGASDDRDHRGGRLPA